ncbi:MAG: hypothetical protein ACLRFG_00235 [Clostridia bacterium]
MFQNKRTKNRLFALLIGIMTLVVVLGLCDGTLAAKLKVSKQAYSTTTNSLVTGVQVDNTTLDYPIEYQIGSVARNISVSTYCRTAQYVRVKIQMRYVSINAQTGACTTSNLSTKNVNIIPFIGSDWYLDSSTMYAYLCKPFTADSTLGKSSSTLLTGVEFFVVDNGTNYSGYSLQFIFTPETSLSASFSGAPAVWTSRIGGGSALYNSSGASGYGSATIYNSRTTDNMIAFGSAGAGVGAHRTPTYVKNDSNTAVGLTFKLDVKWHDASGNVVDDLPINRVKVNLAGNALTPYNSAGSSASLYKVAGTTETEADQLQYTTGTYFYTVRLGAYQTISIVDSIEIINYNWTAQTNSDYYNHHVTVQVIDVKMFALNTADATVTSKVGVTAPTGWASNLSTATGYNQVSYGLGNMIKLTNTSTKLDQTAPSTIISATDDMTVSVTYKAYVAVWVQYSSDANVDAENYDIVAGEYYLKEVNSGVTIQVDNGWNVDNSVYKYGSDSVTGILGKDRAVQLYSKISITNQATLINNVSMSSPYTDSLGNTHLVPDTYTPNYLLMIVPTFTTATSGGSTASDFAGDALVSKSTITFASGGINSYAIAVRNNSNLIYSSVSLSLTVSGTVSAYGLNTGWTQSGTTFTCSSAVRPGQTIVAIGSIKGTASASVTINAYVTFSTSSTATNQTIDVIDETSAKGIYTQDSTSAGVNYNGNAASSTKVVRITNISTNTLYIKVSLTNVKFIKAGGNLTKSWQLATSNNWTSNKTQAATSATYYYNGVLTPGATITLGGSYSISDMTSLSGASLIFAPIVETAVVNTSADSFTAPSGWTYTTWTTKMTTLFNNYYNYTYTA